MTHSCVGPLVRAISTSEVTIWAEFSQACSVILDIQAYNAYKHESVTVSTHTITIGGHHYVAPQAQGLQPATWYTYHLRVEGDQEATEDILQCFRTLDSSEQREKHPLRLAYGSCRRLNHPQQDTLNAFGQWLIEHVEQRETQWPHVLLLIGDQIYADQPPPELCETYPLLNPGASSFEDFTHMYRNAWTRDTGIRQVLAILPSFMIFDDHEISNNWNTWPTWRARLLQQGLEQMLVDGLVAYWVYQGWGNILSQERIHHPLAQIMQAAEQSNEDILDTLREAIRPVVSSQSERRWHYTIPTQPPIFVTNARADRTAVLPDEIEKLYAPTRIMGEQQMNDLRNWLHAHSTTPAIIVSSVPVLLPPLIGLAEYLMGIRLWRKSIAPLRWLGRQLSYLQLRLSMHLKFDHWPVYIATWNELIPLLTRRTRNTLILSGDVHFSYTIEGHQPLTPRPHIYQLVSSPIQNELSSKDRGLIEKQSYLQRITYGGLATRLLPLQKTSQPATIQRNHLFENTLAMVTLEPADGHNYAIKQEYLGIVHGKFEVIGRVTLPRDA